MTKQLRDGMVVGLGNPLLDIQGKCDKAYLDKWGLKENDAILAEDSLVPMFEELTKRTDVEFVPGGATQNALRLAQWIWARPNTAIFFGCIGRDEYGRILAEKAKAAGVNVQYQVHDTVKTGTCAALINGEHRSLAAHLAAANHFTIDHLDRSEHKAVIDKAEIFYSAGFHLTVCPAAVQRLALHCHEHPEKTFIMNLSAPFITQFFKQQFHDAMPYVDLLFGNEDEAAAWAKANDYGTEDVTEIAIKLSNEPKKSSRRRTVIITQGGDDVVCVEEGKVSKHPVVKLAKEKICDTNGAGDAFVGGFLAQYARGASTDECIRCGIYTATVCLQNSGCTVPVTCDYK